MASKEEFESVEVDDAYGVEVIDDGDSEMGLQMVILLGCSELLNDPVE